jgi:hypothetical protein
MKIDDEQKKKSKSFKSFFVFPKEKKKYSHHGKGRAMFFKPYFIMKYSN